MNAVKAQRLPFLTDATFRALTAHAKRLSRVPLRALLDEGAARTGALTREAVGLYFDASRQHLDAAALADLLMAAEESRVADAIRAMFAGDIVNATENRPALHTALRHPGGTPLVVDGEDIRATVTESRARCRAFVASVRSGTRTGATGATFTDVVNIGIGGSDLGPVMAVEALKSHADGRIRCHFASNVDGVQLTDALGTCNPATTLFIVCSKTFTTQETLANAHLARQWVVERLGESALPGHFAAVSVNETAMNAFGIGSDARFAMWDWVGGRYSLWSAIGLAVELAVGSAAFEAFLAGGHTMDEHVRTTAPRDNLAVLHGLIGVWNRNFLGFDSHAILPYDQRLHRLPAYLQQLVMESNGKHVRRSGEEVQWDTAPIIWGEPGSNSQHSFFQLLHQGTARCSMDFLLPARSSVGSEASQGLAAANCLAQAEAFARGYTRAEAETELKAKSAAVAMITAVAPHKVHHGGRPSSVILFPRLDPATLGTLIALYEHSVYVQSVLWDINAFDQWGVELGKKLAVSVLGSIEGRAPAQAALGAAALVRRFLDERNR